MLNAQLKPSTLLLVGACMLVVSVVSMVVGFFHIECSLSLLECLLLSVVSVTGTGVVVSLFVLIMILKVHTGYNSSKTAARLKDKP